MCPFASQDSWAIESVRGKNNAVLNFEPNIVISRQLGVVSVGKRVMRRFYIRSGLMSLLDYIILKIFTEPVNKIRYLAY